MTAPQARPGDLMDDADDVVLRVEDLTKDFVVQRRGLRRPAQHLHAVAGVSFEVRAGQTLSLVGESGCGKSTTARAVLRLVEPTSGRIVFRVRDEGSDRVDMVDITQADVADLRRVRRNAQIVFQDPVASLNPRMTVEAIVAEPLVAYRVGTRKQRAARVRELLEQVGLKASHARRHPRSFSGGQRQRIGIARALALRPSLIILDEPVSALDVSVQAQVLNLLDELQQNLGLSYLFIAHDLAVVRHVSTDVAVMYLGKIVEKAERRELFEAPLHPYTHSLMSAVPIPDPTIEGYRKRIILESDIPSAVNPPTGCHFRTRCPIAQVPGPCSEQEPELQEHAPGHWAACHFPQPDGWLSQTPVSFEPPTGADPSV
jgi:peptide/nickel transport system ATP-binding protein